MLVTEEMLAPLRERGFLDLDKLPAKDSTHTSQLYFPSPAYVPGVPVRFSDLEEERSHIHVVPVLAFLDYPPPLSKDREWLYLEHQCAGYACRQVSMIATALNPSPEIKHALDQIGQEFYFAQKGCLDPPYQDTATVSAYAAALGRLGLHCEKTGRILSEALYPIDCTRENLETIDGDPMLFDRIAGWQAFTPRYATLGPVILLLAENSD